MIMDVSLLSNVMFSKSQRNKCWEEVEISRDNLVLFSIIISVISNHQIVPDHFVDAKNFSLDKIELTLHSN